MPLLSCVQFLLLLLSSVPALVLSSGYHVQLHDNPMKSVEHGSIQKGILPRILTHKRMYYEHGNHRRQV